MLIIQILREGKSLFYNSYCPICHGYWKEWKEGGCNFPVLKKLKVIGAGTRKHICINCSANDRLKMIWYYLNQNASFFKNKNILHIAPEKHLLNLFKENTDQYYPRDLFDLRDEVKYMDITQIDEFEDNSFDLIVCNHVLEHINEDTKAMKELYRVLKHGGKAITQIPYSNVLEKSKEVETNSDEDREREYGQYDHVRIYTLTDFEYKMKKSGFTSLIQNPYQPKSLFLNSKKLGLNPEEALFLFKK